MGTHGAAAASALPRSRAPEARRGTTAGCRGSRRDSRAGVISSLPWRPSSGFTSRSSRPPASRAERLGRRVRRDERLGEDRRHTISLRQVAELGDPFADGSWSGAMPAMACCSRPSAARASRRPGALSRSRRGGMREPVRGTPGRARPVVRRSASGSPSTTPRGPGRLDRATPRPSRRSPSSASDRARRADRAPFDPPFSATCGPRRLTGRRGRTPSGPRPGGSCDVLDGGLEVVAHRHDRSASSSASTCRGRELQVVGFAPAGVRSVTRARRRRRPVAPLPRAGRRPRRREPGRSLLAAPSSPPPHAPSTSAPPATSTNAGRTRFGRRHIMRMILIRHRRGCKSDRPDCDRWRVTCPASSDAATLAAVGAVDVAWGLGTRGPSPTRRRYRQHRRRAGYTLTTGLLRRRRVARQRGRSSSRACRRARR